MEKRDYLMDQIEQLGQALALIFSKLQGFKSQGKVPEGIEMTSFSLKSELGFDIDELSAIPSELFVSRLQDEKKINFTNFDLLADILLHIADDLYDNNPESDQSLNLYEKCLKIYTYLNDKDLTFSFERQSKIARINGLLY
jgi:hypothetical protein